MAKTPTLIPDMSFRHGAFFRGVHSDPDPYSHHLFEGLGGYFPWIQKGKLSGASRGFTPKKGETLRALAASLSSVGLSRAMALWVEPVSALVAL